ncbi:MAG: hypothetical protein ABSD74_05580 [Rhizomicrobium sp.]|jgi:hypothetical protein
MILMLAPAANMQFASMPSGSSYVSDADGLITIVNNSTADQIALMAAGCRTLLPVPQGLNFATLAALYATDNYVAGTFALVYADPTSANNGTWEKTSGGNGAGNWSQLFNYSLSTISAAVGAETARAEAAEAALSTRISEIPSVNFGIGTSASGGPVVAATTGALPSNTYGGGVLTATANGALPAQDGVTLAAGQRLLVKNEATAANNGLYVVTQAGSGSTPYILTRAGDASTASQLAGLMVAVLQGGTTNGGTYWLLFLAASAITVGATPLYFTPFPVPASSTRQLAVNGVFWLGAANLPSSPSVGDRWILGYGDSYYTAIAQWTGTSWIYVFPLDGDQVWNQSSESFLRYNASLVAWCLIPGATEAANTAQATANQAGFMNAAADGSCYVRAQFAAQRYRLDGGPAAGESSVAIVARASSAASWPRDNQEPVAQFSGTATRRDAYGGQACERASTNFIQNSNMAGAATPSTLPTDWILSSGVTATVNAVNTINGYSGGAGYVELDVTLSVASLESDSFNIYFQSPKIVLSSQVRGGCTLSAYIGIVSSSFTDTSGTFCDLALDEYSSGGSYIGTTIGYGFSYPTTIVHRSVFRAVPSGNGVSPYLRIHSADNGNLGTGSIRLLIAMPQLEDASGEFDYTSWIPTTSGSVSRNAETCSLVIPAEYSGSADVFLQHEWFGEWLPAQSILSGTVGINPVATTEAATNGWSGIADAYAMQTGTYAGNWQAQNALAEALYPTLMALPFPGETGGIGQQLPAQYTQIWNPQNNAYYGLMAQGDEQFQSPSSYGFLRAANKLGLFQFEARPGDQSWWDIANPESPPVCHLQLAAQTGPASAFATNATVWGSFAFELLGALPMSGAVWTTNDFCVLNELHQEGPGGIGPSGPFQFVLLPGDFLGVNAFSNTNVHTSTARIWTSPAPLSRGLGQWHRCVYTVTFTPSGTGNANISVWVDGAEVITSLDVPCGYSDATGYFHIFCLYRQADNPNDEIIRFANQECGISSLANRTTSPLPIA